MYLNDTLKYLIALSLLISPATVFPETLFVGEFSAARLESWQKKVFDGETSYQIDLSTPKSSLKAASNNSASGLYREIKIDLNKTPYLNWSWKIENVLTNQQEQTKEGDDYPARVYIVFSGGLFFWQTRALNYVWSSHQPVYTDWPNAYTDNAHMIAIESGDEHIGEWLHEKRNVREDYKRVFGKFPSAANAIAIMTDTDNTGQTAVSYYGDIFFTSD